MIGVNLSGAEFGSTPRGVYGIDYIYPNASELDYYHSKGVDLIRLPFGWERMQPVLAQGLSQTELARMMTFLDAAAARGMKVVMEPHNFGRYDGQTIGSAAVPFSAFKDFWIRMAGVLNGHPAVWGLDLMNEPHDMGGANVWSAAAQAAVDGIRSTGYQGTIVVPGDSWSGAWSWQQANQNLKVNDPLDRIVYEAHQYFDRDNGGEYNGTYDQEHAYATMGADRLKPFLDWLHANNVRGYVGEYGVPDTDPRWLTVMQNVLQVLDQNNLSSTYWSGGPWWDDYSLGIEPRNGTDRPQMDVLEQFVQFPVPGSPVGTVGDDTMVVGQGAHDVDGSYGFDTAVFAGARSGYDVHTFMAPDGHLHTVVRDAHAAPGDAATLQAVEVLRFDDGTSRIAGAGLNHASNLAGSRFDDVVFQSATTGQVLFAKMIDGVFQDWGAATAALGGGGFQAVASGNVNPAATGGAEVFVQQQSTGAVYYASLDGGTTTWGVVSTALTSDWKLRAVADLNGDASVDAVVQNRTNGTLYYADLKDGAFAGWHLVNAALTADWEAVGAGDLNGDGFADVVVRQHSTGTTLYADMKGGTFHGWAVVSTALTPDWKAAGVADLNGNGIADVIFQNTAGSGVKPGTTYYADVSAGTTRWNVVTAAVTADWVVRGTADVDNDGFADVLFQNATDGTTFYANMGPHGFGGWGVVASHITSDWHAV